MGLMSPQPTPKDPWPDVPVRSQEELAVRAWRYKQARRAGLNSIEASLFAYSRADIGHLRTMAAAGLTCSSSDHPFGVLRPPPPVPDCGKQRQSTGELR